MNNGNFPAAHLQHVLQAYQASDDPLPQAASHVIGDGDFRAIGAEFLEHFVRIGGLRPDDSVLDIGCGFGRMALPLARYLAPDARYLGFDIVAEPIDWCRAHVAPLHAGFGFEYLDINHPLYRPHGSYPSVGGFVAQLPDSAVFQPTFAIATSVFTHLEVSSIQHYLADLGAMLRPGGTLFLTAFLIGEEAPPPGDHCVFPVHGWQRHGLLTGLIGTPLTAAVGIPQAWLLAQCAACGLLPRRVIYGHWRWGASHGGPFQDMLVFGKQG